MKSSEPIGWKFVILWVLSIAIGSWLGGFLGIYAGFSAGSGVESWVGLPHDSILGRLVAVLVGFAVATAIIAVIQQQLLKLKLADTKGWVLYSVLAVSLSAVTTNLLSLFTSIPINPGGISGGIGIGLATGVAQGWILRRTRRSGALAWIVANAVAGGVGFRLLNGFAPLMPVPYGLITAGALIWLLRETS